MAPTSICRHHDVSLVVVSRAPLAELLPYKQRMGWKFDWLSAYASDFNFDMQVSFTDKQIAAGDTTYNFETRPRTSKELPAAACSTGTRNGDIFLTFMSRSRGGDPLIGAYHYLDMTPKGRNETGPYHSLMDWVRLHDEYGDRSGTQNDLLPSRQATPHKVVHPQCQMR